MKKRLVTIMGIASLALVMVLTAFMAACAKPAPLPTEPQTFTFNSYEPNEKVYQFKWRKWYTDQITKRTNGLMQFDLRFAAGYGYPFDKFIPVTGQGLVDFSGTMDGNESGNMPEFIMGSQTMLFDSFEQFEAYRQKMEPELKKYLLEKWNVVLLANAPMSDQSLMMKEPIKSLDDLKGKKIRVLSEASGRFLKALGAVPVTIMFPELFSSLERGVIDGMVFYHMGLVDMKFYEIIKYIPIRTMRMNWGLVVVNKELWDSFPKEWRDTITALNKEYVDYALNDLKTLYGSARKISEEKGVDFTPLPPAEMQKALEIATPLWGDYAAKYGDLAEKALKVAREVTGR